MDASVTRISSNKKLLDEECAMIQGLKQVVKVTKLFYLNLREPRDSFATLSDIPYGLLL